MPPLQILPDPVTGLDPHLDSESFERSFDLHSRLLSSCVIFFGVKRFNIQAAWKPNPLRLSAK